MLYVTVNNLFQLQRGCEATVDSAKSPNLIHFLDM